MQKTLPRLDQLVSVRGLAAWLVVFYHSIALLRVAVPELPAWLFGVISYGYIAVDFFFVLSGFIIFINYHDRFVTSFWQNSRSFIWNRFSRIYPVHFLMLMAYLGLALLFAYLSSSKALPPTYTLTSFVENLLLVQAWSGISTSWNVPSWSISAEWFVYLLFPMIAILLRRYLKGTSAHFFLVAGILAGVYMLSRLHTAAGPELPVTDLPLVRATYEFLLGTVAGSLYIHRREILFDYRGAWLALALAACLGHLFIGLASAVAVPLVCFLLVCLLCVDTSVFSSMLTNRPLVYLGEISYSTYMVHYFVYDVYKAGWLESLNEVDAASLFASFGVVLVLSMIMHKTIELPSQKYLRSGRFKGLATMVRV